MKKQIHLIFMALAVVFISHGAFSQVLVSDIPAATADPSAMLDVQSTSKGFLFPRMTLAQRTILDGLGPATSMIIYQTNSTPGFYYNTGTPASPIWEKLTDGSTPAGYWTQVGSDIYYNTGNVGVGTTTPGADLDVNGAIWAVDSIAVSGRPGRLFINGESNYAPMIRWAYEGTEMFYHDIWGVASNPYWSMSSTSYKDFWMIAPTGRLWHDYQGTTSAHVLKTDAESRALSIENTQHLGNARGIQVSMSSTSNPSGIIAVGGWSYGLGTGVYGMNVSFVDPVPPNPQYGNYGHVGSQFHGMYGQHYPSENRGSLGASGYGAYGRSGETDYHWGALGMDGTSSDWGVYGAEGNAASPNFGGIGNTNYGVYGEYGAEDFFGALGTSTSAVYGQLGISSSNLSPGDYAIRGVGNQNSGEAGNGYGYNSTIGGVVGFNQQGTTYSFGVAGYTQNQSVRSGAIIGASSFQWGSLGYRSSASANYGGYFTNAIGTGAGKSSTEPSSSIGIGVYGDLFGATINGNVYGLYAEGENYGIYAHGDMYRTGADVHLQQDNNGQNNVMYTLVSTEMTVQTYGVGQMQNGKSKINFDDAFANVVSSTEPIVVTITPIGQTNGVYLDKVDGKGFSVAENNDGKSNVQYSWIAIGKRKGYENMSLPADVIASDYTEKIQRGLVNDGDPNAQGEGLYYQNGMLRNGQLMLSRSNENTIEFKPSVKMEHFVVDETIEAQSKLPMLEEAKENKDKKDEIKK